MKHCWWMGTRLAQSGATWRKRTPEKPLLPAGLLQRAQVRNLCGIVGCDIQPAQSMSLSAKVADLQSPACAEQRHALAIAWSMQWIERGLQAVEEELTRCAGRYCVGDDVTLADVYLLPQVFNARVCNVELAAYPTVSRAWWARSSSCRPSCALTRRSSPTPPPPNA